MVITYHGGYFFKLQLGDTIIAVNPVSKGSKLSNTKFGANICLESINHPDFNGVEQVTFGEKKPFCISGPGEYEIGGTFIKGAPSHSSYGGGDFINTIYTFNLDGINLCFLGALDSAELPQETKEQIDEVDILFVPVGESSVLTASVAYKMAVQFEPKLIIPCGDLSGASLKPFLKEAGANPSPVEKLTIKKKDIEGKEDEIVVMTAS